MTSYQGNIVIKNPARPAGPFENGAASGVWKLNEALAFVRQGIWPTQGVPATDPSFPYVSLLLSTTSLGNANNNLFVDSSGAFNPISRNGNTTQGSATPYSANWSNYFDGSGDWIQFASTSQFAIATSTTPFTIEAWIYPTAAGSCIFTDAYTGAGDNIPIAISLSNGVSVDAISGRYVALGYFNGSAWVTAAKANAEVSLNTWTHIACVFTGSTFKIYYNGVDVTAAGAGSSWGMTGNSGSAWYVGRRWDIAANDYFTGYISNLRFVNGTAVYTSAFTPSTTPLTAITNTVLLTCQSNRFRDASANNLTATRNGDTRTTNFSPFSPGLPGITYNQSDITNWSGYFDGTGDYLTVPSSSPLVLGTGDFTIELWAYWNVVNETGFVSGSVDGTMDFAYQAGTLRIGRINVGWDTVFSSWTPSAGIWYHIAFTRSGGTVRAFVDGVQIGTAQTNTNSYTPAPSLIVGGSTTAFRLMNGYLSNLRIIKGTALYTSNFTPPTGPLTAISGTSLLTLQNAAFADNSTNNFVITPFGNTTVTGNSPFNTVGYWSNYFDGSGDYLSLSAASALNQSGDFTIEAWIYLTATPSAATPIYAFEVTNFMKFSVNTSRNLLVDQANVGVRVTGSTALSLGTWNHIAFVRSGSGSNNCKIYLNGVQEGQFTDTSTATASGTGRICSRPDATSGFLTCYLSNLRVTNTAVYTSAFTPSTTPLTAISGTQLLTCQASRFIDSSSNAFALTVNGNPSVQSFDPFYTSTIASNGGSMYFDGTGDYLTLPAGEAFQFGTGDFTVEMWVYPLNALSTDYFYIDARNSGQTNTWCLFRTSANALSWFNGSGEYTGGNVLTNQWSHLAYSRSGSSGRLFINGVLQTTATDNTNYSVAPTISYIGGRFSQQQYFSGYMNGLRVTKSALYTAAFTPPTAPLTPSASTRLLVNGMNAGAYDATAINDMETVGNAQISTAVSKFGGSSLYLDGTTDYAVVPTTPSFGYGTGDFTIEFWLYPNSTVSQTVVSNLTSASSTNPHIYIAPSGSIRYYTASADRITGSTLSTGQWYHIAISRSSGSTRMFINGTQSGSTYTDANNYGATAPLGIGTYWNGSSPVTTDTLNGYLDDLRITKGVARYTTNFTPPTQAFPPY